mmetsp:Transcript_41591/g.98632  ORF Transcript_41591/g.98632 Transcript_41591/m.98632 type:complete len:226 (+) Transcript_41591:433-1110(+)
MVLVRHGPVVDCRNVLVEKRGVSTNMGALTPMAMRIADSMMGMPRAAIDTTVVPACGVAGLYTLNLSTMRRSFVPGTQHDEPPSARRTAYLNSLGVAESMNVPFSAVSCRSVKRPGALTLPLLAIDLTWNSASDLLPLTCGTIMPPSHRVQLVKLEPSVQLTSTRVPLRSVQLRVSVSTTSSTTALWMREMTISETMTSPVGRVMRGSSGTLVARVTERVFSARG